MASYLLKEGKIPKTSLVNKKFQNRTVGASTIEGEDKYIRYLVNATPFFN